eukprot:CAMPEP_0118676718 /NCGR_PEP_ID=MMETSP0800-20121206/2206_1 /TAXON_ID=210618 ORGANISM="Striatella unipunctata, Strain CCMP2910" /NCGR_SAMPLE_ID=MMETSP0800 /ASSEMBLY_ACC=CAM_ASM_000638 /LENGTH=30 /DNA_ID= /DNA_START= /DNA_END= /DNA_ORIENTATION=
MAPNQLLCGNLSSPSPNIDGFVPNPFGEDS